MITGNVQHVVVDFDGDDNIVAVWGPFPTEEEANAWPGLPGGPSGRYRTHQLRSAPQWFEGFTGETEDEGTSDDD